MGSKKNSRIAVTGATGLVGSHLVARLIMSGYGDITLIVRDASRLDRVYKTLRREGVDYSSSALRVVEVQLTNPVELAEAFEGIDVVFNCAAVVAMGGMSDEVLITQNVSITSHVVNAALQSGVGKLVHVSSIAALGNPSEGEKYVDETMSRESIHGVSAYSAGKFLSENEIKRGAVCGLRTVVVNPSVILGSGDWKSGSPAIIPLISSGLKYYTEGVAAFVDVRDVARAMVELSECEAAVGEQFIVGGESIKYRELVELAARAAGEQLPRKKLGATALGFAWRAAAVLSKITGRQLMFTRELARVLQTESYYSNEKLKKYIGFEFTPISQTLERVVNDYLAEKKNG